MTNWCQHCKRNTRVRRDYGFLCCEYCGRIIQSNETSGSLSTTVESDCSDQSYKTSLQNERGGIQAAQSPQWWGDGEESTDSTMMPVSNDRIENKLDQAIDLIRKLVEYEKNEEGLINEVGEALDELKNSGAISGEAYNAVIVRIADSMGMRKMFLRMNVDDRVSFINFLVR